MLKVISSPQEFRESWDSAEGLDQKIGLLYWLTKAMRRLENMTETALFLLSACRYFLGLSKEYLEVKECSGSDSAGLGFRRSVDAATHAAIEFLKRYSGSSNFGFSRSSYSDKDHEVNLRLFEEFLRLVLDVGVYLKLGLDENPTFRKELTSCLSYWLKESRGCVPDVYMPDVYYRALVLNPDPYITHDTAPRVMLAAACLVRDFYRLRRADSFYDVLMSFPHAAFSDNRIAPIMRVFFVAWMEYGDPTKDWREFFKD